MRWKHVGSTAKSMECSNAITAAQFVWEPFGEEPPLPEGEVSASSTSMSAEETNTGKRPGRLANGTNNEPHF